MRVEIFGGANILELENKINNWLKARQSKIKVVNQTQSESGDYAEDWNVTISIC